MAGYQDPSIYKVIERGNAVRTIQSFDDGTVRLGVHQDVEPIIEHNKYLRELQQAHGHRGETLRRVASVPIDIYEQSVREGWDEGDWRKWLNAPENEVFRVWRGRL